LISALTPLTHLPLAASDWVAAIAGVAGVVVGGMITTGGTIWVQRAANKRQDKQEREAEDRERNATISLLHASLEALCSYLHARQEDGAWQAPVGEEWLAIWQDRARALAGFVNREEYETVAAAFLVARLLSWQGSNAGAHLSDEGRALIATWLERIDQGLATLDQLDPAPR
jgi:hypothetical protein